MQNTIAIIAAVIAAFATVPYILDVLAKKTKPNIVSWFTWTLLTGIATAAALAAGEPRTALLTGASTLCSLGILIAGLRYGIAKFSLFDGLCQVGAIVGLILWLALDSPTVGIVIPVTIDLIALLPTLRHSWLKPGEETWQAFLIGSIAASLTLLSLSRFNIASTLYPVYLLVANLIVVGTVLYRRKVLINQS